MYQGFARIYKSGPATDPLVLLTTGASVNLVLEPIWSSSVWGAGWYNAVTAAHYADAAIRFEGDINFELSGSDDIWDFIGNWCVNERAYPKSLDISSDGTRVYGYQTSGAYLAAFDREGAWNTRLSLTTTAGSFVTATAGVQALNRVETIIPSGPAGGPYIGNKTGVIATDCTELAVTNPLNPGGNNVDPIPFWRTQAQLLTGTYTAPFSGGAVPQAGCEAMEWSTELAQNTVILYTCNGSRLATALLMGAAEATGTVVLYNDAGVFDPILGPAGTGTLTSPYLYAENTWFRVTIPRGGAAATIYIEIPAVVISADAYDIAGQSDVTRRSFTMRGLGGRCNSLVTLPSFIMSDSGGLFVAP
jgi:hypothetical protein